MAEGGQFHLAGGGQFAWVFHLILETKGQDNDQNITKRGYLEEWCKAINQHGGFGKWSWAVSFDPNDLEQILQNSVSN
jgi:type III restriction enzyme